VSRASLLRWARPVAAGATLLFLVDLLLNWQHADVRVVGMVHVHHVASGWHGWGALAGLCAVVLLAMLIADRPKATAAFGFALLAFTVLAVAAGDTSATVHQPMVDVEVDTIRWPAWVGLVLAAVAALASVLPYLVPPHGLTPRQPHTNA
jgi:hypothetical protein